MGFRIAQVAELARQMNFTPTAKRARQLANAEELLPQIDPAKGYPFDFILYRITEYHPKIKPSELAAEEEFTGQLLTGVALRHDLGLFIEQVSDGLNLPSDAGPDVLTIEQVGRRYNVSQKTIQRCRRRGLAARRFVFPDGRKRVGFFAVSVDRFFKSQRDLLGRAADFTPIGPAQRLAIQTAFRRLAQRGCSADEIAARIGRRLNRSPVAVREVIDPADLDFAAPPLKAKVRRKIVRAFRRGMTINELAARARRPKSSIHRVLIEWRLQRLNRYRVKYFDDPLYHQPDAADVVRQIVSAEELAAPSRPEDSRVPAGISPALAELCRCPPPPPGRERALFLKMNFHKFQFASLRRRLDESRLRWRDLTDLQSHRRSIVRTRNQIVTANLRLVISVARRHLRGAADSLTDLVSDGSMALMRAVDGFDFHRGNRFSTYATFALMKEFARGMAAARIRAHRDGDSTLLPLLADASGEHPAERLAERDHVQQLLARLDEREQIILRAHFGLSGRRVAATYDELGRQLGMSAPCIKRIEQHALAKLRQA
jgi:RNA polymerase primary sigma factor